MLQNKTYFSEELLNDKADEWKALKAGSLLAKSMV